MKKIAIVLAAFGLIISCGKEKTGNMIVKGKIDGLRKGTLYLQKLNDTLLVSVDSIALNGSSEFTLYDQVESPEIYHLALNKKENEKIAFFGEPGEILITSKLEKFVTSANISGSLNHDLLQQHRDMALKFNGKQLDLLKEKFEAQKNNDIELVSKLENDEKSLLKRKYYFTTNFAVNNANYEVAPYLALTDLYFANVKLLDTVNNSLSNKVKASKYGKELQRFIDDIKQNE